MKNTVFTGAATALVTPLTPEGVDFAAFADLIEWQIGEGIDALVSYEKDVLGNALDWRVGSIKGGSGRK